MPPKVAMVPLFSKKEMVLSLTKLLMLPVLSLTNFTICPLLVNVPLMLPELVKSVRIESAILVIFPLMVLVELKVIPLVAVNVSPLSTSILLVILPLPL